MMIMQGAIALPLIFYLDGTHLSQSGTHQCKPWMMGIGNHCMEMQNKKHAKKVRNTTK